MRPASNHSVSRTQIQTQSEPHQDNIVKEPLDHPPVRRQSDSTRPALQPRKKRHYVQPSVVRGLESGRGCQEPDPTRSGDAERARIGRGTHTSQHPVFWKRRKGRGKSTRNINQGPGLTISLLRDRNSTSTASSAACPSPDPRSRRPRRRVIPTVWRSTWRRGIRCRGSTWRGYRGMLERVGDLWEVYEG